MSVRPGVPTIVTSTGGKLPVLTGRPVSGSRIHCSKVPVNDPSISGRVIDVDASAAMSFTDRCVYTD